MLTMKLDNYQENTSIEMTLYDRYISSRDDTFEEFSTLVRHEVLKLIFIFDNQWKLSSLYRDGD